METAPLPRRTVMNLEIERKFLVAGDVWRDAAEPTYYCQGYLNLDPQRTVRVRIAGSSAQLTIKGISRGASRAEFEYPIPIADAESLLTLCEQPPIEKYRRRIPCENLVWEVDEFLGQNAGLVVAEVELESEDQKITLPSWVANEVTGDPKYFNANLVLRPYCSWRG